MFAAIAIAGSGNAKRLKSDENGEKETQGKSMVALHPARKLKCEQQTNH